MRPIASLLFAFSVAAIPLASASDASACGACFHGEMENTQVTGHKMIFSISKTETTLWDQLSYTGDPTSFAWVLPIKGTVTVGLSSDALFESLDNQTQVGVNPPPLDCPAPPACYQNVNGAGGGLAFDGDAGTGGVTVIAQAVVGPYQTVQLSSQDPAALTAWLTTNGYVVPPGFAPVISAYVTDGFDFLALKLLPGAGITSMKPVRVSSPGAGASLPLRMIAAGVGVTTPITLWVLGEGRYQPTNFPWFIITEDQLVWDFNTSSSNYKDLKMAGLAATSGRGWLLETSTAFSEFVTSSTLSSLVQIDPLHSGYGDDLGMGATDAYTADVGKLFGDIDPTSMWITRMHAELPRTALATDLTIGAASTQTSLASNLTCKKSVNTPPCPTYPPCGTGGAGGASGTGGAGAGTPSDGGSGCAVGNDGDRPAAIGALVVALALGLARRRRQSSS